MGVRVQMGGKIPDDLGRAQRQRGYQEVFPNGFPDWRLSAARRIKARYLNAYNGVPYALRFQGWCKKWGINV